jgi:hypothetical protein
MLALLARRPRIHITAARGGLLVLLAFLLASSGCESAMEASTAAPLNVCLEVESVIPILDTWAIHNFWDEVRESLAKYNLFVVPRGPSADGSAKVWLGDWHDRVSPASRSIRVDVARPDGARSPKTLHVQDFQVTTLDVATEYVAAMIAAAMRSRPDAAAAAPPTEPQK